MASFVAATTLDHPCIKLYIGPQPTTVRGATTHITKHPKLPKIVYPSGKYVIVRDLENPTSFFIYRGHNAAVSVAKFSPSGYWVASGDVSGKVRIWSWDNPEHILKIEVPAFNGEIKDLDWDPESKRIIAVGEGQTTNARVFMWDTGNNLGELTGHGKRVLAAAYKPSRPFRIITASEDTRSVFYSGPPFVMDHSNSTEHSNWVNCVRYSPDGNHIVTVSSDKKIVLYDGKTGVATEEIPDAHTGTIYAVAWSGDSRKFVTSSADKSVKVWDLATRNCEATFQFDEAQMGSMQNGVVWVGSTIASLSLNGDLNLLNPADPSGPRKVLSGLQVTPTALAVQQEAGEFYTGSYDGVVLKWTKAGVASRFSGTIPKSINLSNHTNKITGAVVSAGKLKTIGFDDKLRMASLESQAYDVEIAMPGQPVGIATGSPASDLVVIAHMPSGTVAYRGTEQVASISLPFTPTCVAMFGEDEVVIGGENNKVSVYDISSGSFVLQRTLEGPRGQISSLAYSPTGDFLAVGDTNREIMVFERGSWSARIQGSWVHHTSRITSLAWSPSGQALASASSDTHVFVWSLENPGSRLRFEMAHKDGVTAVGWLSEDELVSTGGDACVIVWDVAKARK